MIRNSFALLVMAVVTFSSCNDKKTSGTKLCETGCEDQFRSLKINPKQAGWPNLSLKQGEANSLQRAVSGNSHVHADVVNGQLAFSTDQNAAHLGSKDLAIALDPGKSGQPSTLVRVVASPAAAALLHQRAVPLP